MSLKVINVGEKQFLQTNRIFFYLNIVLGKTFWSWMKYLKFTPNTFIKNALSNGLDLFSDFKSKAFIQV